MQETTQIYREQKQMSLGIGNTNGEEWYRLRSNAHHRMLRPKEVRGILIKAKLVDPYIKEYVNNGT